ncbi:MAG: uridine kinase [Candidatus Eisenbacteria bacterium]
MSEHKAVLIGIAGGTGSGKTTVADIVGSRFKQENVITIHHDSYYCDRGDLSFADRERLNYDHPSAFENDLLVANLRDLINWRVIEMPVYDFATHTRLAQRRAVQPAQIIILEGILVLADEMLRSLMDIKIFIEADSDERFIRRLLRDMKERGRDADSVIEQYAGTVRPMHLQFVEPTKRYADIIIPGGGHNAVAIDLLVVKIRDILRNSGDA